MGYYIETPGNKGKAKQLIDLYDAKITPRPTSSLWKDNSQTALICEVDDLDFNFQEKNFYPIKKEVSNA